MDRGTRNVFALILVAVLAVTGGAALILGGSGRGSVPATAPPGTTEVDGVVVAVASRGLDAVDGFTLRKPGGELVTFRLDLADPTAFPPGHLAEHQATASPVRVWYRQDGARLVAVRLEDVVP